MHCFIVYLWWIHVGWFDHHECLSEGRLEVVELEEQLAIAGSEVFSWLSSGGISRRNLVKYRLRVIKVNKIPVPLKPLMIEDGLIAFNHATVSNGLNWYFVITLPDFAA